MPAYEKAEDATVTESIASQVYCPGCWSTLELQPEKNTLKCVVSWCKFVGRSFAIPEVPKIPAGMTAARVIALKPL